MEKGAGASDGACVIQMKPSIFLLDGVAGGGGGGGVKPNLKKKKKNKIL